ncbi:FAD binding domain-containing protein [Pectinatus brassicae]|uniref:CO/xanthine dehydrogenase FAD-binding subunit n=1 Tax=Pectinatus brassicae TaxID=862415 RepID=A0A840USW4_9FIRM|nr:FAD binding domain-containing protein [Pectinatus brassicae]MBB5335595.1 CO/xanthine dehydrogenase FAD-binding subunit [Pectinatus brassicae]
MVKSFMPKTLAEALKICDEHDVCPIAGGTDLMVRNHQSAGILPTFTKDMLFIKNIDELTVLEKKDMHLIIGANITLNRLLNWENTPQILHLALQEMAAPAIRNMGTIAGNICNASPAGDTLPPLYALDAIVCLKSIAGERELPIREFILGPGKTALKENELLTAIKIPIGDNNINFYKKAAMRKAAAISKVSIAMTAKKEKDKIVNIAIAIGAVGPTVVRLAEAEDMFIKNNENTGKVLPDIYDVYDRQIKPIDDIRSTAKYRKQVAMNLLHYVYEKCIK